MADNAERAEGIEVKAFGRAAGQLGGEIFGEAGGFAQGELRGGRAGLAGFGVADGGAIAESPKAGMAGDGESVVDDDRAAFVFFYGERLDRGAGGGAGSPDESGGRNFGVAENDFAGLSIGEAGIEAEFDAAFGHFFLGVVTEGGTELGENAIAGVDQDHVQFLGVEIGIIGENAVRKIVEGAGEFDARETAAGDDEGEERSAERRLGLAVGAFEHFDDVIADADGVEKAFEIEGKFFDVGHAEIVGDGT